MTETFEGGCSCGAVRFRLASRPLFTQCCHCLDCQKQTGGAFAINALIETSRIEMLTGEPIKVEMPSPSGRGHDIYRCEKCEVALWSDYGRRPYVRFVRVSTPNARAFEIFYDMKQEWPPESMARREAASKAG